MIIKEKEFEETLWQSCDKLRVFVEPAENKHADNFSNDQHNDLEADYIMANPPFNLKDWRGENELLDDSQTQLIKAFKTLGYEL